MKHVAKQVMRWASLAAVLPVLFWYRLFATLAGPARAFPGVSQFLSLAPGMAGIYLRHAFYRSVLPECGDDAWIGFGTLLTDPRTQIGAHVYLGSYTNLGHVTLERDALIGSFVSIMNGSRQHGIARLDVPVREQPGVWPHVTIGEDSWIGDHAVVMADVGKHCVVAAGAVVTKPVPDYAIVAGCPARIMRYRNRAEMPGESVEELLTASAALREGNANG
jgi:acetyltransferase-like isoleucine patch superfamily enzyme